MRRLSAESALSSTSRTLQARAGTFGRRAGGLAGLALGEARGSRTRNSDPRPRPSLRASTVPPCEATRERTSASPRPSPPRVRSRLRLDCVKGVNSCLSVSGSIPIPVSRMLRIAAGFRSSRRTARVTVPPTSVNLAALARRFDTTWASRTASPLTQRGPSCSSTFSFRPEASRSARWSSALARATATRSTSSEWRTILPLDMREASRSWSTSDVRWTSWRSITSSEVRFRPSSAASLRKTSSELRRGARGLRSSCPSRARNWSFRRVSSSRTCRARFRSVMSRKMAEAPTSCPLKLLTGESATDTETDRPSLVRRTDSKGATGSPFRSRASIWSSSSCSADEMSTVMACPTASSVV